MRAGAKPKRVATCGSDCGRVQRESVWNGARAVAYARNHRALQSESLFPRLFLPIYTDGPAPPLSCFYNHSDQPILPLRTTSIIRELDMVKNTTVLTPDNTPGPTPARRRSEDELDSNRAHKKPRTRVRYAALSPRPPKGGRIECELSYSCGECHRRKQKVGIYILQPRAMIFDHHAVRQTNTMFACQYI